MKRPMRNYDKLWNLMFMYYMVQSDLVPILNKKGTYISNRFVGEQPWNVEDVYALSDYFKELTGGEIDIAANFTEYFPHPDTLHNSREMVRKLRACV